MSDELKAKLGLEQARNDALRKLGRNIFNFGQVEQWLKYLVTVSDVTTVGAILDNKTVKKADKAQKMMLGQLVNEILEKWHPDNLSVTHQIQDLFDVRVATSFRIEMDLDGYEYVKNSYAQMVEDRNYLVHKFNKNFPLNTVVSCHEASAYLDELRERHLSSMQNLHEIVKTHLALVEEIKESFDQ